MLVIIVNKQMNNFNEEDLVNVHVTKTVPIEFKMVVDAYQKVRQGGKATGIDGESWEDFDKKLYFTQHKNVQLFFYLPSCIATMNRLLRHTLIRSLLYSTKQPACTNLSGVQCRLYFQLDTEASKEILEKLL